MSEQHPKNKAEPPAVGSRWHRIGDITGHVVRVMAVADGWVMARFKGAVPFTEHVNQWSRHYQRAAELAQRKPLDGDESLPR